MSDRRRARTAAGERPDGPGFSPILHDHLQRQNVAMNHAFAEGFTPNPSAVAEGYDRNENPWMHGRRAHDIVEMAREVLGRGE
ncbi:hypothetical protein [Haloarcula rubripromontorii]|uniref:hypothetical protein n=1 Tax=Haloarcula rubripromontorii TaxID=1705562 RepID=UPI00345B558E